MKTTNSSQKQCSKQRYEAPVFRSMDVVLEQGIAAGSVGVPEESMQKQWLDTDRQSQTVENVW